MKYTWSKESQASFHHDSHRGRYLKCDFLVNPPPAPTPLYAIQYLVYKNQPIYTTPTKSLVLFSTDHCFYVVADSTAEALIGRWPKGKKAPAGPDPESRLDTAPYVWDESIVDTNKNKETKTQWQRCLKTMHENKIQSIEALYERIVMTCDPRHMSSTFTADEFRHFLPAPLAPNDGAALGTQYTTQTFQSGNPPSRRGVPRKRGRLGEGPSARDQRKQKQSAYKGVEQDDSLDIL